MEFSNIRMIKLKPLCTINVCPIDANTTRTSGHIIISRIEVYMLQEDASSFNIHVGHFVRPMHTACRVKSQVLSCKLKCSIV